jgi:stress response protein YsnF
MNNIPSGQMIPVIEEHIVVQKQPVETGRVNVTIATTEDVENVSDTIDREAVLVERIPVGRFVDAQPAVREEGDATIFPVVEEVFVKRLLLREEVRVTRVRSTEPFEGSVTVRRQTATVEREGASPPERSFQSNKEPLS